MAIRSTEKTKPSPISAPYENLPESPQAAVLGNRHAILAVRILHPAPRCATIGASLDGDCQMIRKFCIAAGIGLIVLMTGCVSPGSPEWKKMQPLPSSGSHSGG